MAKIACFWYIDLRVLYESRWTQLLPVYQARGKTEAWRGEDTCLRAEEGRNYLEARSLRITPIICTFFLQEWASKLLQIMVWGHTVSASCWYVLVCFKILRFQQQQLDHYLTYGFLWVRRKARNRAESPFASNSPRTVTCTKQNQIYKPFLLWRVIYLLSQVLTESWITTSYIIGYLDRETWSAKFTGQQGEGW